MRNGIFLLLMISQSQLALSAPKPQPSPPASSDYFSDRLSNSFNTVPLGRVQTGFKTVDHDESVSEFEENQKLQQFRCANGDKKCRAELEMQIKKSRTPEYRQDLGFDPLGK